MILTVDLGTSVTKVVVWDDDDQVVVGRSALHCRYTAGNRAEQDAESWWPSVVAACAQAQAALGARAARVFGAVEAIGFAAARQTFVPVTADATPLGPALLWSDRRAGAEAVTLAGVFGALGAEGADFVRRRTGVVLDAGSVAAKVAWLDRHEPERIAAARWLLAPRDLVAWHLTGQVRTDHTLASATGLFEMAGAGDHGLGPLLPGLVDNVADRLPDSFPSITVSGGLLAGPAGELELPVGIPVVIGAGDRPCEVLGTHASEACPMVSWGTTANVSVPLPHLVDPAPEATIVTRGALGGWLVEGGLSAAGSAVDWLARLAHLDVNDLMARARSSPPGARGVIALPWFGGARAPWWRAAARGALVGLSFDHDIADLARAVVESVAWDVARCLEAVRQAGDTSTAPRGLVLGGGGANVDLWSEILTAVTALPARRSRAGEAASAGAAMLVSAATGVELDLPHAEQDEDEISPDASMVAAYATLRPSVDAAATAVIGLGARGADEPMSR